MTICLVTSDLKSEGFNLLGMAPGARSAALAGAGSSLRANLEGICQNPAALADLDGLHLSGTFSPILDMVGWGASAAYGFEKGMTVAIAAQGLVYGEILGDIRFNGDPGTKYSPQDLVFAAGVGIPFLPKSQAGFHLDWGLQGVYANQQIGSVSRSEILLGSGLIAGFQFSKIHELAFSAGAREIEIKNLEKVPGTLYLGVSYQMDGSHVGFKLLGDLERKSEDWGLLTGMEIQFLKSFALRGGYHFGGGVKSFSIGGSARLRYGNLSPCLEYAFIPFGDLGGEHKVQLSIQIQNKKKEEKKMETPKKAEPEEGD
ncbi:MAG: hypothetical protein JNM63_19405 [Spirochaetia bacterium]|nr:hypothetical protein [Spirochaetia bacterium]